MNTVLFLSYIILATTGLLLLKRGMGTGNVSFETLHLLFRNRDVLLGAAAYCVSFVLWLIVLSRNELSTIFPLGLGALYVLITTASILFLGEPMTSTKLIGTILVGMGILFLTA